MSLADVCLCSSTGRAEKVGHELWVRQVPLDDVVEKIGILVKLPVVGRAKPYYLKRSSIIFVMALCGSIKTDTARFAFEITLSDGHRNDPMCHIFRFVDTGWE